MYVQILKDGTIEFVFRANEADMALDMLSKLEPPNEEVERAIQDNIDMILAHNDLHKWRTLN